MKASEYIKQHGDFEITEQIEKHISQNTKNVWDLKNGDICFYSNAYNEIKYVEWVDCDYFESVRSIGLITVTREALEFKLESMKVYEELKRYAKEFTDDEWEDEDKPKYEICINGVDHNIYISPSFSVKNANLYFESPEKAKEAIKSVGEERVKKYYLGVGK